MNRQSSDSIAIRSSSIALLQERFRQLQRAKEMREERDLVRQITEPHRVNPTTCQEPSRLFFHSELIRPPRPSLQGPPSLHHNLQSKHADIRAIKTPPTSTNLQYSETVKYRSSSFDDSDIDTSLHL